MTSAVVSKFAKRSGVNVDRVDNLWAVAKARAEKAGFNRDDSQFFAYATSVLKRMLKMESSLKKPATNVVESYLTDATTTIQLAASMFIDQASTIAAQMNIRVINTNADEIEVDVARDSQQMVDYLKALEDQGITVDISVRSSQTKETTHGS